MPSLSIESNGRLEKTAVYYNGEQLGGIKELVINIDEDGTFDAVLQYEGTDKVIYNKQVFNDYLENVKVVAPTFTEEDAYDLQLLTIESDGELDSTMLYINNEQLEGVVNLYVHIRGKQQAPGSGGFFSVFRSKPKQDATNSEFQSLITFRNEDDSLESEEIF